MNVGGTRLAAGRRCRLRPERTAVTAEALPFILLQGALFGTTLIASRFSVGQFHPLVYLALRMLLASLGHAGVYMLGGARRRPWPKDPSLWVHAGVLGIFGTAIPTAGIVSSLLYQSSGVTSSIIALGPAFTLVLAHFLLSDEKLNARKGFGVGLALSGGILLAIRGESGLDQIQRAQPAGFILAAGGIFFSSLMTIYARRNLRDMPVIDVASVRMFAATAIMIPAAMLFNGFDLEGAMLSGYLALGFAAFAGTFAGMLVSFYVIKRFGATASAMTVFVIPVVANIGGVLILDERITSGMLIGMVLIALGLAVIQEFTPDRYPAGSV
jgi:drug/metabolite transporter (DMT)-like permease